LNNYVDSVTGGNGLDWMNKYLGNVNIQHYDANRDSTFPGIGSTTVNLFHGWLTQDGGARWLAHEMGHVWDIKTGFFGVYGGVSDQLNAAIGGDRLSNPFSCSFCDNTGLQHIPVENQWLPKEAYGNNSTNDYLAEAFALSVYPSAGPQVPIRAAEWVKAEILVETARLVVPFGTQISIP
jgi:hypothetical protein